MTDNPSDFKVVLATRNQGKIKEIMAIFQRLNREQGISIVVVTHEPDIAHYADRIITFKDGRVLTDELVAEPRNAKRELENWVTEEEEEEEPVA